MSMTQSVNGLMEQFQAMSDRIAPGLILSKFAYGVCADRFGSAKWANRGRSPAIQGFSGMIMRIIPDKKKGDDNNNPSVFFMTHGLYHWTVRCYAPGKYEAVVFSESQLFSHCVPKQNRAAIPTRVGVWFPIISTDPGEWIFDLQSVLRAKYSAGSALLIAPVLPLNNNIRVPLVTRRPLERKVQQYLGMGTVLTELLSPKCFAVFDPPACPTSGIELKLWAEDDKREDYDDDDDEGYVWDDAVDHPAFIRIIYTKDSDMYPMVRRYDLVQRTEKEIDDALRALLPIYE